MMSCISNSECNLSLKERDHRQPQPWIRIHTGTNKHPSSLRGYQSISGIDSFESSLFVAVVLFSSNRVRAFLADKFDCIPKDPGFRIKFSSGSPQGLRWFWNWVPRQLLDTSSKRIYWGVSWVNELYFQCSVIVSLLPELNLFWTGCLLRHRDMGQTTRKIQFQ